jgi:hypothetical protein
MKEKTIIEAVADWFQREFGAGAFCGECRLRSGRRADLIYVRRADSIHVVEAKAVAANWQSAFRQLRDYPANYKWLALPEDDYYAYGTQIASECAERGYGLLLISGGPKHRIVEVRRQPVYREGRFDYSWPAAFCAD